MTRARTSDTPPNPARAQRDSIEPIPRSVGTPNATGRTGRTLTGDAIRTALLEFAGRNRPLGHQAVAEFWLPGSNERADLVLLGSGMHGFEIKARNDTLTRLPRQVKAYGRVFDWCTAVVHARHLAQTGEMVPAWWGLIEADDDGVLREAREALTNPAADDATLVQLLWKEEARQLLLMLGCEVPADEPRAAMWLRLLALVDVAWLRGLVGEVLAQRDWSTGRFGSPDLRGLIETQARAFAAS